MFDNTRLRAELSHIHHTLSVVAAAPRGKGLVEDLRRSMGGTNAAALWQALYADCLRVVYSAVNADGVMGDDEMEALYEFVFGVARSYANILPGTYGDFTAVTDEDSARQFLDRYAADSGPFGRGAPRHWPGLMLCRRAAELGEGEALERYERIMSWLITEACRIGGVTEADSRWRGRVDELDELRRALARDAEVESPESDLRVQAFLTKTGVFAAVQQAGSIYEPDPFDVETVYGNTRAVFEQMVERATIPSQHGDRGRMLLVLGESGTGKTHLLRGFRRYVHEYGRGFVVYAQLHSRSDDYAQYLLQHVIDSLSRPYAGPKGERTALHELALGLPRLVGEPLKSRIDRLVEDTWEEVDGASDLASYVNGLVDALLEHEDLASFDPDLLRVLLYALYPSPATTSRVYKYLRCVDMNSHDRKQIGDVVPRTGKDDPRWMIRDLGRLAFVTQQATLVLMLDQAELAGWDSSSQVSFQRATDTLHALVSQVPSMIAVIACLSDLYTAVRPNLSKFALDRLERDPQVERLQVDRPYEEIEEIVARRLSWLYADSGAVHRPEEPVYPIPEAMLRRHDHRRIRDVLEWCHEYQARCAAEGRIIEEDVYEEDLDVSHTSSGDEDLQQIAAAWNDAVHSPGIEIPDEDDELLAIVSEAAKACADELGLALSTPTIRNDVLRLELIGPKERDELAISITNRGYQRGAFGGQIEDLRRRAGRATPIAVRTLEFPSGPNCDRVLAALLKADGRRVYVDVSTLRALVAFQQFEPSFALDRIAAWRRRDRPISGLPAMIQLFDLDRLRAAPAAETAARPATAEEPAGDSKSYGGTKVAAESQQKTETSDEKAAGGRGNGVERPTGEKRRASQPRIPTGTVNPPAPTAQTTGSNRRSGRIPTPPAGAPAVSPAPPAQPAAPPQPTVTSAPQLNMGVSPGFRTEAREIDVATLLRHTGILGSSGSGKTTLALNLIEQVLERDVAVVLVDRKGDLAGYAKPDWWERTADPERARRLAERVDVRLFTPGTRGGRPLSISVVPDLEHVPEHEHDRMVQYAASALGAMMRLGDSAADTARRAILTQAIAVLTTRKTRGGLTELITLLEERDDALVARASRYDDKLFKRLVQDLETVRLSDADLFDPTAEPLTAETLIGRKPDGKVPLAIASTRFLGDVERVQSWVAHLIGCLSRHAAKTPSAVLRTIFMIDEADVFMPAGASKPPSKEPLQDLLKRARAAGLGVVLASQSPADFDYRSREQINTWFLGRIADKRSIDKMRPLFEHRPTVRGKLGNLEAGRFVMLQDGGVADLERTPSLLRTDQIPEAELATMAARGRPPVAAPSRPR